MGFFYLALKIPQIIAITIITNVASYFISLILSALSRIGLFKSHDPDDHASGGAVSYVLILDGASPSLQPVPINVVTAAIKDRVNIVRYEDYVCPYVGSLFKSHDPDDHASGGAVSYVLILDGASPSLQPVPINVVTAAIKDRVNIVRYEDYVCPYVGSEVCTVCLDCVRADDLVRELVNCKHVFHQECLDRWVDEGQVNCPLCRSILLPPKRLLSSVESSPIGVANDDPVE
ncbi:Zinc finger, RING-CH-type [Artemisia annua]|uniref:Zinc finger, RING-CH-type n=1 Tax=Artemisia annua TaxID=35608 RepID=A0A2U1QGW0_ARTAN|nr:Zinc finger, RING-CH-type [Artemisia annua]